MLPITPINLIEQLNQIRTELNFDYQTFLKESTSTENKSSMRRSRIALTAFYKKAMIYKNLTKTLQTLTKKDLINANKK